MIEVKVTFSGLKIEELKLESTIKQLIQNLAEYAERTMRSEAPERTGRLKSSIKRKVKGYSAEIGPETPYSIFVELGTRPHVITPVYAHTLRFEVGGEMVFTKIVHHPGTKPNPFVRRTADKTMNFIPSAWKKVWGGVATGLL